MQITLATPNTLRLTFAYDARIVERVKQIPGRVFDEKSKDWLAPVNQLSRCEELFPKAQFAYDVFAAECDAMRASAAQLHAMLTRNGATFSVSEDDIVLVEGAHVSPLTQEVVRDRSRWFAPLVKAQEPATDGKTGEYGDLGRIDAISDLNAGTDILEIRTDVFAIRNAEILATGIASAVEADKRKRGRRWYAAQGKPKQVGLFEDNAP